MTTFNATKSSAIVLGPVRAIGVQSRSVTGTMPNGNRYESTLERDFMLLMEFDPRVDVYTPQPLTLSYQDENGKRRRYTPDGLVEWRADRPLHDRRPILVEIKYREAFAGDWRQWRRVARAAQAYAAERGWLYQIYTERQIRTPLLGNARFLLPYLARSEEPERAQWILDRLSQLKASTPGALVAALCQDRWNQAAVLPIVWRLLAERRIGFDVSEPLTMQSPIWSTRG